LYFAQSNSELVYLNKYVIQVENISKLPSLDNVNVGDFYYIKDLNVLCTKKVDVDPDDASKEISSWVQINKNTDTLVYGKTIDFSKNEDESKNGVVSYDVTLN
jgi:hypothetical protein